MPSDNAKEPMPVKLTGPVQIKSFNRIQDPNLVNCWTAYDITTKNDNQMIVGVMQTYEHLEPSENGYAIPCHLVCKYFGKTKYCTKTKTKLCTESRLIAFRKKLPVPKTPGRCRTES